MSENIKVVVRVRPLSPNEIAEQQSTQSSYEEGAYLHVTENQVVINNNRCFAFDAVLDAESTQDDVFGVIGNDVVEAFLDGRNAATIAYGQTGAGKTYTMQALTMNVIDSIFTQIEERVALLSSRSEMHTPCEANKSFAHAETNNINNVNSINKAISDDALENTVNKRQEGATHSTLLSSTTSSSAESCFSSSPASAVVAASDILTTSTSTTTVVNGTATLPGSNPVESSASTQRSKREQVYQESYTPQEEDTNPCSRELQHEESLQEPSFKMLVSVLEVYNDTLKDLITLDMIPMEEDNLLTTNNNGNYNYNINHNNNNNRHPRSRSRSSRRRRHSCSLLYHSNRRNKHCCEHDDNRYEANKLVSPNVTSSTHGVSLSSRSCTPLPPSTAAAAAVLTSSTASSPIHPCNHFSPSSVSSYAVETAERQEEEDEKQQQQQQHAFLSESQPTPHYSTRSSTLPRRAERLYSFSSCYSTPSPTSAGLTNNITSPCCCNSSNNMSSNHYNYGNTNYMKTGPQLREDAKTGVYVHNLTEVIVRNANQLKELISRATATRHTATTLLNANSSRSHCIVTLTLTFRGTTSKMCFVDLAGSERLKKSLGLNKSGNESLQALLQLQSRSSPSSSHVPFPSNNSAFSNITNNNSSSGSTNINILSCAEADALVMARMREGISVNTGLLALGNVIVALCENKPHIPYRASKLTRLLQPMLNGWSQTCMVACISPYYGALEETLNTLKYAYRAKSIKIHPHTIISHFNSREDAEQTIISLRLEIKNLESKLSALMHTDTPQTTVLPVKTEEIETNELEQEEAKKGEQTQSSASSLLQHNTNNINNIYNNNSASPNKPSCTETLSSSPASVPSSALIEMETKMLYLQKELAAERSLTHKLEEDVFRAEYTAMVEIEKRKVLERRVSLLEANVLFSQPEKVFTDNYLIGQDRIYSTTTCMNTTTTTTTNNNNNNNITNSRSNSRSYVNSSRSNSPYRSATNIFTRNESKTREYSEIPEAKVTMCFVDDEQELNNVNEPIYDESNITMSNTINNISTTIPNTTTISTTTNNNNNSNNNVNTVNKEEIMLMKSEESNEQDVEQHTEHDASNIIEYEYNSKDEDDNNNNNNAIISNSNNNDNNDKLHKLTVIKYDRLLSSTAVEKCLQQRRGQWRREVNGGERNGHCDNDTNSNNNNNSNNNDINVSGEWKPNQCSQQPNKLSAMRRSLSHFAPITRHLLFDTNSDNSMSNINITEANDKLQNMSCSDNIATSIRSKSVDSNNNNNINNSINAEKAEMKRKKIEKYTEEQRQHRRFARTATAQPFFSSWAKVTKNINLENINNESTVNQNSKTVKIRAIHNNSNKGNSSNNSSNSNSSSSNSSSSIYNNNNTYNNKTCKTNTTSHKMNNSGSKGKQSTSCDCSSIKSNITTTTTNNNNSNDKRMPSRHVETQRKSKENRVKRTKEDLTNAYVNAKKNLCSSQHMEYVNRNKPHSNFAREKNAYHIANTANNLSSEPVSRTKSRESKQKTCEAAATTETNVFRLQVNSVKRNSVTLEPFQRTEHVRRFSNAHVQNIPDTQKQKISLYKICKPSSLPDANIKISNNNDRNDKLTKTDFTTSANANTAMNTVNVDHICKDKKSNQSSRVLHKEHESLLDELQESNTTAGKGEEKCLKKIENAIAKFKEMNNHDNNNQKDSNHKTQLEQSSLESNMLNLDSHNDLVQHTIDVELDLLEEIEREVQELEEYRLVLLRLQHSNTNHWTDEINALTKEQERLKSAIKFSGSKEFVEPTSSSYTEILSAGSELYDCHRLQAELSQINTKLEQATVMAEMRAKANEQIQVVELRLENLHEVRRFRSQRVRRLQLIEHEKSCQREQQALVTIHNNTSGNISNNNNSSNINYSSANVLINTPSLPLSHLAQLLPTSSSSASSAFVTAPLPSVREIISSRTTHWSRPTNVKNANEYNAFNTNTINKDTNIDVLSPHVNFDSTECVTGESAAFNSIKEKCDNKIEITETHKESNTCRAVTNQKATQCHHSGSNAEICNNNNNYNNNNDNNNNNDSNGNGNNNVVKYKKTINDTSNNRMSFIKEVDKAAKEKLHEEQLHISNTLPGNDAHNNITELKNVNKKKNEVPEIAELKAAVDELAEEFRINEPLTSGKRRARSRRRKLNKQSTNATLSETNTKINTLSNINNLTSKVKGNINRKMVEAPFVKS